MAATDADKLLERLTVTKNWPPKWECAWGDVRTWQALREADSDYLKKHIHWDHRGHGHDRHYIVDPMPSKISGTFAELIFGQDPTITAAVKGNQKRLDMIVEDNELPGELQMAGDVCSSEGEVWWRWLIDLDQAEVPVLEFHSRLSVLPVFRGKRLLAAALISTFIPDDTDRQVKDVYRYFEIHADTIVMNVLFKGKADKLGTQVGLDQLDETADLPETWDHGLPMLVGRVVNKMGRRPQLGISDYAGVKDYLFALNETATIGQENARLTLKKRVVVPDSYLDVRGQFPAGADVIIAPTTDQDPDKAAQGLAQVEWSFDAQAFISYKEDLERTVLGRVGLARQLVDAGNATPDGRATGTALKLRLIPSILATEGKGRFWDDALPMILGLGQQLDALTTDQRAGYKWTNPAKPPVVERSSSLPEDETEEATRHSLLIGAEIESRQTAVEALHPDWDDIQVTDELAKIKKDIDTAAPVLPPVPILPGDSSPDETAPQ